MHVTGRKMQVE